jgi:hypothetical protein
MHPGILVIAVCVDHKAVRASFCTHIYSCVDAVASVNCQMGITVNCIVASTFQVQARATAGAMLIEAHMRRPESRGLFVQPAERLLSGECFI